MEWLENAQVIHKMAMASMLGPNHKMPILSRRELEVLGWTARGKDYIEIAMIMGISEHTVRSYMRTARAKLGSVNLAQAVAIATKWRLISP